MKRTPHIFHKVATLLLCTLLSFSCTKEDVSLCAGDVRVYFTFINKETNPSLIDRMHLYVFDHQGYFVGEYRDNHIPNFNSDYFIDCSDLLPGNYRFIAWGGKDEQYYATSPTPFEKGKTTFSEALLKLKHPGNTISTPVPHLFHSTLGATLVVSPSPQYLHMPLAQLSNTIHIHTVGLPAQTGAFSFRIIDNNDSYTFDRSFASLVQDPFTYMASCTKDNENQLHASLNVLRLSADRRTPQLQLFNETTNTLLYPVGSQSGDLIGLILSATPNVNFDTTHTFNIVLTFTGDETTGFDVSVSVNGWLVNDEKSELIE